MRYIELKRPIQKKFLQVFTSFYEYLIRATALIKAVFNMIITKKIVFERGTKYIFADIMKKFYVYVE